MTNISVIIPVKNGAATLEKCLIGIRSQTISNIDIIILDSESSDNSKEIALQYGAHVISIEPGTFNHGLTRNYGVQFAKYELIYFTVQDAKIEDADMLKRMSAHFDDSAVQSVTGMQATPHDSDKNPVKWFRRFTEPMPQIISFKKHFYEALPPKDRLKFSRWDNVNSMYRKQALQELPFAQIEFGEDMLWAKNALQKGWTIVRDPSLVVYHYHHHNFRYTFKAAYSEYYTVKKYFDVLPPFPAFIKNTLVSFKIIARARHLSLLKKISWTLHNFSINISTLTTVIIFRILFAFGGQNGIDKGLKFFCATVPQGRQNITPKTIII